MLSRHAFFIILKAPRFSRRDEILRLHPGHCVRHFCAVVRSRKILPASSIARRSAGSPCRERRDFGTDISDCDADRPAFGRIGAELGIGTILWTGSRAATAGLGAIRCGVSPARFEFLLLAYPQSQNSVSLAFSQRPSHGP